MMKRRRRFYANLSVTHLEDRAVPSDNSGGIDFLGHISGCLCNGCVGRTDITSRISIVGDNQFLTGPQQGDLRTLTLTALNKFATQAGLLAGDVRDPFFSSSYTDGNLSHAYVNQRYNNLEVINANIGVHFTAAGELITINGGFVPGLSSREASPIGMPQPTITAPHAAALAAHQFGYTVTTMPEVTSTTGDWAQTTNLFDKEVSTAPISANLAYVYTSNRDVRLVWEMEIQTVDGDNWYHVGVDALDGAVEFYANYVSHFGTYNVYAQPHESPDSGPRSFEVNPFDPSVSPFGWHDTDGVAGSEFNDTRGNNVSAQDDIDANNTGGTRPDGGPNRIFDLPINLAQAPSSYLPGATAQLFYMNNMMHDITAKYGFTEAAGNFQSKNYSGQGLGNDAVQADAQDGSGTDNANFGTPVDGVAPRMQMFRWTQTNPNRDSDLDNGIIAHEYGHGISNRLTGGPGNSSALNATQSGGMGEGWSDFFAIMFTQLPTDLPTDRYPMGTYVLGQNPSTGVGIRSFPYSFNMTTNPMTFSDYGTGGGQSTQVHWSGARWCSALWDLNWLLINKYGFDTDWTTGYVPGNGPGSAGNKLTMQLVLDGMKLQPALPSFIDARNAILNADLALTGGANRREIWTAFARRGLGFGASTADANSTSLTTSFAMPPEATAPAVISATPKGVVSAVQSSLQLTFSEPMDQTSFSVASDVRSFTGPGGVNLVSQITGFSWVNATTLQINFTAQTTQGNYTLVVGPDIRDTTGNQLDQNLNGVAGNANDVYSAMWRYDALQLQVTSITPANGAIVPAGLSTIDVTFNEPVNPTSVTPNSLQLSIGTVSSATLLNPTTVRFTISGLPASYEGPVYLNLKYGAVLDAANFPSAKFASMFTTDISIAPFPTPLTASGTPGWLAYEGSVSATVAPGTDNDVFTINLDADQGVSIVVTPTPTLRPLVELLDTNNVVVASATTATAGEAVLLTGVPVSVAGVYSIRVSSAAGTSGSYSARLMLNAAPELESSSGPRNDTRATAQPFPSGGLIGGTTLSSIIAVGDNFTSELEVNDTNATANSLARSFSTVASSPLYMMHLSGNLTAGEQDWFNIGTLDAGEVITLSLSGGGSGWGTLSDCFLELWRSNGGTPVSVTTNDDGGPGLDSLIRFTITTADTYFLMVRGFGATDSGSYNLSMQLTNTGTAPTTGGAFTAELEPNNTTATANNAATSWRQVQYRASITGNISTTDTDVFSVPLTAGDRVSFQVLGTGTTPAFSLQNSSGTNIVPTEPGQFANEAFLPSFLVPTTGTYFLQTRGSATGAYTVNVLLNSTVVPPAPSDDYFSFTATAGEQVRLALKLINVAGATGFQVQNSAGTVLATGVASGATNYEQEIANFTAPSAGTYYVRVTNTGSPQFQVALMRNGIYEREANDSLAAAQAVPAATGEIGGFVDAANTDWFSFNIPFAGLVITATTTLPGGGPGEFVNLLDPRVEVYTPTGSLLASDDNSAADGKNARVRVIAPVAGNYVARVLAVGSTSGAYSLKAIGSTNIPPANITVGGPYAINEGQTLTLLGSATDADGDFLTYSWDLNGDGTFGDAVGANPTVSWAALEALGISNGPSVFNVAVEVTDNLSAPITSTSTTLTLSNTNPTATGAVNGGSVNEGSIGSVTISGSTDLSTADVTAGLGYAYDFNNDGTFDLGGDGLTYSTSSKLTTVTVPAIYLNNGPSTQRVVVRVMDQNGGFNDYFTDITVKNVVPTAQLTNGGQVFEGSAGAVTFSSQNDPSTVDVTAGFKYAFDFDNDGNWDLGDGVNYAGGVTTSNPIVPSNFLADGNRLVTIKARIFDQNNGFSEYTTNISVRNVTPTATLNNTGLAIEGQTSQVVFSNQVDPSAADTSTGFKYSYDFDNDGNWDLGTGLTYNGSVANATPTVPAAFITEGPGTITVRARIFDKDGGFNTYTTTITITNSAPTAAISDGGDVAEGQTGTVSLISPVDSFGDIAAGLMYAFDFNNDGTFELGDGTYANGVSTSSAVIPASYFPDGPSTLTVRARVIDRDGDWNEYTTTLNVTNTNPTGTITNNGPIPENTSGLTVQFTSSLDDSITDVNAGFRYAYDFNNDGVFDLGDGTYAGSVTSGSAAVDKSYLQNGPASKTVRTRIIDQNDGYTDYTTVITVTNTPPNATISGTATTTEGSLASVALSNQTDDSPVDFSAGFRYAFDFNNDGKWDLGNGTYANSVTTPSVNVPASYLTDGPFSRLVKARIIDQNDGFRDFTWIIAVTGVAPTATISNNGPVREGEVATILLSDRKDISPEDQAAGFRYAFDFNNDGTFDVGNGTFAGSEIVPAITVPAKYLTNGPGQRTVRVRIIDKDNDTRDLFTNIGVSNLPPTASLIAPAPGIVGEPTFVTFLGATDPSPEDIAAGLRYSFSFSGQPGFTGPGDVSNSLLSTAGFAYTIPGTYQVTARVADRDGAFTEYNTTVVVRNVPPTAKLVNSGDVVEGGIATVSFSNSKHPSSIATNAGFRYAYDFNNDGVFELGTGQYESSVPDAIVNVPAELLADGPVIRTIRARIIEVNGLYTDYTTTIQVSNAAPTATFTEPAVGPVYRNSAFPVSFTNGQDASTADATQLKYRVELTTPGTVQVDPATGIPVSVTLSQPGRQLIRGIVTDPNGAETVYPMEVTIQSQNWYAVGPDNNQQPIVKLFNGAGQTQFSQAVFGDWVTSGVRVATADFNADGIPDLVAATGPGVMGQVRIIDGQSGKILADITAFEERFTGGVFVATGDITGDGRADLVISPDEGGGPRVRVFDGNTFKNVADFFGIDDVDFRGGARASLGDLNGDGFADLVVSAGFGGGPRVAGFDGRALLNGQATRLFADFFVYEQGLRNGAYVAAGDIDGDGKAELITGGGPGGGPRVQVFASADLMKNQANTMANFFAGDQNNRGGIRIAAKDLDGDGKAEVVTGAGTNGGSRVSVYRKAAQGLALLQEFDAYDNYAGGVFVG